jgi:hypothetical protein
MKKIIIFLVLSCIYHAVFSQDIVDFLYLIPSKYVDDLSLIERKQLVKSNNLVINNEYNYAIEFDKKNRYLIIYQGFIDGKVGFGEIEICYWNYHGKKLIGLSNQGGNHCELFQNNLKFFEYNNGRLQLVKYAVFDGYTNDFEILEKTLRAKLFLKMTSIQKKENEKRNLYFLIKLPREGKNIRIVLDDRCSDEFDKQEFPELNLIWQNNGKFK